DVLEITTHEKKKPSDEKYMTKQEKQALITELSKQMREAAKLLEFEYAAYLRDKIEKIKSSM
ncbi:MAG: UvrB/UvrC motif-containing protein, partial [Acutalibacteraceae bacterium]